MKAEKRKAVVETIILEPEKVILELSVDEAKCLGAIVGNLRMDQVNDFVRKHGKNIFNIGVEDVPDNFTFFLYEVLDSAVNKAI